MSEYTFERWIGVVILVLGALCFLTAKALDAWDRAKRADQFECHCGRCQP